jgi:hypothetical protein
MISPMAKQMFRHTNSKYFMRKLLVITIVAAITVVIWKAQSNRLRAIEVQNERLTSVVAELGGRSAKAKTARQSAEKKLAELRMERRERDALVAGTGPQTEKSSAPPEPDPSRHGGWPQSADFFYLPKEYLTNVSYKLFNGGQLTDEGAGLFGMTPAERQTTDKLFDDLVDKFHSVELSRMTATDPPEGWVAPPGAGSANHFDSGLIYNIPDLTDDLNAARTDFLNQLQQTVGGSRADLIASAASSYLADNLNDLGTGNRTVGFLWQPEADGSHSLWFAASGTGYGAGSFQLVTPDLDPNSQIAYYGRLLGVQLPQESP